MRVMRLKKLLFCTISLVVLGAIYFSISIVFKHLLNFNTLNPVGLSEDVINKYNLNFYCSFDRSKLWDEVQLSELESHYVKYSKGKFGGSRKFERGYNGKIILN